MVTIELDPSGAVLAHFTGGITRDDQVELRDTIADVIGEQRSARVLVGLQDIDYSELDADDIWLEVKPAAFLKGTRRLAVLTEPENVEAYKKFTFMAPFPTKAFPFEQRHDAIEWLLL